MLAMGGICAAIACHSLDMYVKLAVAKTSNTCEPEGQECMHRLH